MQRVILILDDNLLATLDALSARHGYHNRSEAARDILCDALNQDPMSPESRRGYAALSYVYEHEKREPASRLVTTQRHHHDLSVVTLHVHISYDDCLEITVLKGDVAEVQRFADGVIAQHGMRHGHLQCLADDNQNDGNLMQTVLCLFETFTECLKDPGIYGDLLLCNGGAKTLTR